MKIRHTTVNKYGIMIARSAIRTDFIGLPRFARIIIDSSLLGQ